MRSASGLELETENDLEAKPDRTLKIKPGVAGPVLKKMPADFNRDPTGSL